SSSPTADGVHASAAADDDAVDDAGYGGGEEEGGGASLLGPLDVVLVEDELERLALMEAGIPNVLSLPPSAVWDFMELGRQRAEQAAAAGAGAGADSSSSSSPAGQGRNSSSSTGSSGGGRRTADSVTSYMWGSREVLLPPPSAVGGQVAVTLALREQPGSRMLAEELAGMLTRERCRVLRWGEAGGWGPQQGQGQQVGAAAAGAAGGMYDSPFTMDPAFAAAAADMSEEGPEYLNEDFAEAAFATATAAAPFTASPYS
ncbi:hypothetical protein Agub_g8509, partial [Astrephomene gubernaculifera]